MENGKRKMFDRIIFFPFSIFHYLFMVKTKKPRACSRSGQTSFGKRPVEDENHFRCRAAAGKFPKRVVVNSLQDKLVRNTTVTSQQKVC